MKENVLNTSRVSASQKKWAPYKCRNLAMLPMENLVLEKLLIKDPVLENLRLTELLQILQALVQEILLNALVLLKELSSFKKQNATKSAKIRIRHLP